MLLLLVIIALISIKLVYQQDRIFADYRLSRPDWLRMNFGTFVAALAMLIIALILVGLQELRFYRAKQAFNHNIRLFESIFENIPSPVFIKDVNNDFRYVAVNQAAEDLTGYTREEIIGKTDRELWVSAFMADTLRQHDTQVVNSPKPQPPYDEFIDTRYQGQRLLQCKKVIVKDSDGKQLYLLSIDNDITEQRAFEQAQAQSFQDLSKYAPKLEHSVNPDTQQLQARIRELDSANTKLALVLKAAKMGVSISDIKNQRLEVDEQFEALLGLQPNEFSEKYKNDSKAFFDFIFPADKEYIAKMYQKLLDGQTDKYDLEYRIVKQGGEVIWVRAIGECIRDAAGQAQSNLGIVFDVTPRRRTEKELQLANEALINAYQHLNTTKSELQLALKAAQMGVFKYDLLTGKYTMDTQLEHIFGLQPGTFEARYGGNVEALFVFIHPDDKDYIKKTMGNLATGKQNTFDLMHRILLPDQSVRWIHALGQNVRDTKGQIIAVRGIKLDITERKQAELEVKKKEELLDAVFESSVDALLLYNTETLELELCNQAAINLFELDCKEELFHKPLEHFMKNPLYNSYNNKVLEYLLENDSWSEDCEFTSSKGRAFFCNMAACLVRSNIKNYYLLRLKDITELVRYQKELIEQKQETEAALAVIENDNIRKTRELQEARDLQLSLLPTKGPDLPNLETDMYICSSSEVGGDYYDYKFNGDGSVTFVVGDATGHGLKAGIMVATAKSYFQNFDQKSDQIELLNKISEGIRSLHLRAMYMGLTAVKVIDNQITITASGMPPVYVYRQATQKVETIVLPGPFLGSALAIKYKQHSFECQPGDTILLISDGMPELFSPDHEMLDYARIKQKFEEIGHQPPRTIINGLVELGNHWSQGRPNDDDITLLVLKMK